MIAKRNSGQTGRPKSNDKNYWVVKIQRRRIKTNNIEHAWAWKRKARMTSQTRKTKENSSTRMAMNIIV